MKQMVNVRVNGEPHEVAVEPNRLLVDLLREDLGLTGTKVACDVGECGACAVLVDGELLSGCLMLAVQVDGKDITTIEGLGRDGEIHPVQRAFHETWAVQCGFCTPGMVLAAVKLLQDHPNPNLDAIREGLDGNLCRCTGYLKIFQAVQYAGELMRGGGAVQ